MISGEFRENVSQYTTKNRKESQRINHTKWLDRCAGRLDAAALQAYLMGK